MDTDQLRTKAKAHRERGNARMAEMYERQIADSERLAQISARQENLTMTVQRHRYRVSLNHNDDGEWYGNAHGRGDVMPAAYVSGQPSRDDCLKALRGKLAK